MRRWRIACTLGVVATGLTGCESLLSIRDPVAGDGPGSDGGIDAAPAPASALLLSEVVLTPDVNEMIEIVNTSSQDVDLSTYYVSDSGNYYRLPTGDKAVDMTDFIVKFPAGAVIKGHKAVTIALDTPSNFFTAYGVMPSYSLLDGSLVTIATNGTAQLTNAGEPIILFQWDGASDLVRDVDILIAGVPSTGNALTNKSGATQDGPDPGSETSKYAVDLRTMLPQTMAPPSTMAMPLSTKRIALEDGHEIHAGTGNGPSGDDETSEDTHATWDDGSISHPFTAPTPGDVPPQLLR